MSKFLKITILVFVIVFLGSALVANANCINYAPNWLPSTPSWQASSQTFTFQQSYGWPAFPAGGNPQNVDPIEPFPTCTVTTNGGTCTVTGYAVGANTRNDCPAPTATFTSPAAKIDKNAPTCGTWSGTGPTFTLANSTDSESGINIAGGSCTAPSGGTCNVTISDNVGNTTSCTSPTVNGLCSNPDNHLNPCQTGTPSSITAGASSWTWSCVGYGGATDSCSESAPIATFYVQTSGPNCKFDPISRTVNSGSTAPFTITANTGYTLSSASGCGGSLSGNTYTTGPMNLTNAPGYACTVSAVCSATPLPMTGALSVPDCIIASGAGSCTSSATWSIANPEASPTAITANGMSNINVTTTPVTVTVPYNSRTFYLYNNAKQLATDTANANCISGTSWDSGSSTCKVSAISVNLSASPTSTSSGSTTLSWTTTGSPDSCQASSTNPNWTGTLSGSSKVVGNLVLGTNTFNITCSKAGTGDVSSAATVTMEAMSGTITASDCIIAQDAGSCNTNLSWSTTNPVSTSEVTTPSYIKVKTANTSTATYAVDGGSPNGARDFYLYNNNVLLAWATATATCESGTEWDIGTGTCKISYSMSGTLNVPDCTIASGAGSCTSSASWSILNQEGSPTAITANGMSNINVTDSMSTPQSGTATVTIPYSSRTFYLYNNSKELAVDSASASCVSGTAWDSGTSTCKTSSGITVTLTASPFSMTLPANSTTLTWATTGSPDSCTASGSWSGTKTTSGSKSITDLTAGTYTYTLTCSKLGTADVFSSATVLVSQPVSPTTIKASPTTIVSGDSTVLTWTSGATSCVGSSIPEIHGFNTNNSASGSVTVRPPSTTTYKITCSNNQTATVKVTVKKKPIFEEN